MGRKADQSARIETALLHLEQAVSQIAAALDPDIAGSLAARLIAEAKGARSSSEAASAGVQALAAVAVKRPDPGELAAAVAENTELTQAVHGLTAEVHTLIAQAAQAPDDGLDGVLSEIRAVRALITPAEPMPAVQDTGSAAPAPKRGSGGRM